MTPLNMNYGIDARVEIIRGNLAGTYSRVLDIYDDPNTGEGLYELQHEDGTTGGGWTDRDLLSPWTEREIEEDRR